MSVKVAVRVRPFNSRQRKLGCSCVVDMQDPSTLLKAYQNEQERRFTFDFSFWSFDQYQQTQTGYLNPTGPKYADQKQVFQKIGKNILDNAWQGYHCCLFAYGQTGSGKSYSMIGYGLNKGIVPITCNQIFQRIKGKKDNIQYDVHVSMLQIYNEEIQDLTIPINQRRKGGLKIRQNKLLGVYVDGVKKHFVDSFQQIQAVMEEGTKNRTVAATQMNATSSRAHTIITIEFKQTRKQGNAKSSKISMINLVDLAGSQRQDKTGATGQRLKEAVGINLSLTTLGQVISILADNAEGANKYVPYRNSALTRILSNALGGNSQTIMICAISPANDNYDETLSTLRYADRAKKIKNKPIVNESQSDKMIRQLKEQNQKLKKLLQGKGGNIQQLQEDKQKNKQEQQAFLKRQEQLKKRQQQLLRKEKQQQQRLKQLQKQLKSKQQEQKLWLIQKQKQKQQQQQQIQKQKQNQQKQQEQQLNQQEKKQKQEKKQQEKKQKQQKKQKHQEQNNKRHQQIMEKHQLLLKQQQQQQKILQEQQLMLKQSQQDYKKFIEEMQKKKQESKLLLNIEQQKKQDISWNDIDDFDEWEDWDDDQKQDNLNANINYLNDLLLNLEKSKEEKKKQSQNQMKNFKKALGSILNAGAFKQLQKQKQQKKQKLPPYLQNISKDVMINRKMKIILQKNLITVGKEGQNPPNDIIFGGRDINPRHATIHQIEGKVILKVVKTNSHLYVNGKQITESIQLVNLDRVVFGWNSAYLFKNKYDKKTDQLIQDRKITWDFVKDELSHLVDIDQSDREEGDTCCQIF